MPTTRRRTAVQRHRAFQRMPEDAVEAELRLDLRCDDRAPASAREAIRKLRGVGRIVGDAVLVASELVSNAVLHSGCGRSDRLTVHVAVGRERLLISVLDPGRSCGAARPRPSADHLGGLGLGLVAQLATRWGSDRTDGHRVWAELALPQH